MPLTLRGVPQGTVSPTPLPLTLKDAVDARPPQNLAAILEEQRLKGAESTRLEALSALLPHVNGPVRQSEQKHQHGVVRLPVPGRADASSARSTSSTRG